MWPPPWRRSGPRWTPPCCWTAVTRWTMGWPRTAARRRPWPCGPSAMTPWCPLWVNSAWARRPGTISSPPWVKRRRTAPRCASSRATTWTRTPRARRRMPTRSLLWSWAGARCASACWAWAPWRRRRRCPTPSSKARALPTGTTPPAAIVGSGPATGRSGWKRRTATWWWWSATPDRTNWPALLRRPPASTCWWAATAKRLRRASRMPTGSRSPWSAAAARP